MTRFVGRARELAVLEQGYRSRGGSFVPIYGRRRVGKTELIRQFMAKKRGALYVAGQRLPAKLQLRELLTVAAEALSEPLLAKLEPGTWKDALLAIEGAWKGRSKLILALDEFQWMAESAPDLPATLQHLWDTRWRDSGRVMIILCGSFVGFMEREVLGKKAPLFGRRTAQIQLRPFGYAEAALFHPRYSMADRARAYFICGGIPLYHQLFDARRSIEMNIESCFLDEYAPLYREAEFLLREELRDLENYHAILMALAERPLSLTDIGALIGLGHNVQYHLQQLIGLGYVARRFPLSGKRPTKQSVRYAIDDPLLRFWFRFVWPNQSFLLVPGSTATLQQRVRPQLEAYFGTCFERLCREALPALYRQEGVEAAFEVGEYWARDLQVDVVGVRGDGVIDVGECKWGAVRSPASVEAELAARARDIPNLGNCTVVQRAFARTVPKSRRDRREGVRWCSLDDLYDAGREGVI